MIGYIAHAGENVQINVISLLQNEVEVMKSTDTTTITENRELFAEAMFNQMTPGVIISIKNGIQNEIDGMNLGLTDLEKSIAGLQIEYDKFMHRNLVQFLLWKYYLLEDVICNFKINIRMK